jgi:hypothetical protein
MCGIVGILGHHEVAPLILESLKRSSTAATTARASPRCTRAASTAAARWASSSTCRPPRRDPLAGRSGIGHTRWATHGAPSVRNAHPHRAGRVSVVHNGIIENFRELREELAARASPRIRHLIPRPSPSSPPLPLRVAPPPRSAAKTLAPPPRRLRLPSLRGRGRPPDRRPARARPSPSATATARCRRPPTGHRPRPLTGPDHLSRGKGDGAVVHRSGHDPRTSRGRSPTAPPSASRSTPPAWTRAATATSWPRRSPSSPPG